MKIDVEGRPAYAAAVFKLGAGEKIRAESGALMSMSTRVKMETSMSQGEGIGGWFKSLGKALFTGESFFQNTYTAEADGQEVVLVPTYPGDVAVHELKQGDELALVSQAYLGASTGVSVEAKWGGGRGFFSGVGLFLMKVTGAGTLVFNAFGGIHPIDIDGKFVIDTGHVVAFDAKNLTFSVRRMGGWFSFFFSGEGLVAEFAGKGRVWMQSRNPGEFGRTIGPRLPARDS